MGEEFLMLVEDNPDDEELTINAFRRQRMLNEFVVARDGQEAIDFLFGEGSYAGRDTTLQPELILLDIHLPKVDGIEVLKRIRADARTKTVPVVILTSSSEDRDLYGAYTHHANSFVRKPVDFDEFAQTVSQLGMYWLVLNHPPPNPNRLEQPPPQPGQP